MPITLNNTPAQTISTPTQSVSSNAQAIFMLGVPFSPSSVSANTVSEQVFTVAGVQTGDVVLVAKPTAQAGLGVANTRVTAANTIAVAYVNATASPIVPTSETYNVTVIRPLAQQVPNGLPSALPLS